MAKLLIKSDYNWADEANFPSFSVIEEDEYDKAIDALTELERQNKIDSEIYVGSNEAIEFRSVSNVISGLEIIAITDEEADIIEKLFGLDYGGIPFTRVVDEIVNGEWEDEEWEDEEIIVLEDRDTSYGI